VTRLSPLRRLRPAPVLLVAVALVMQVSATLLDNAVTGADRVAADTTRGDLIALPGVPMVLAGALVLQLLPRHAVGRVLTGFGLFWVLDGLAMSWAAYALPRDLPGLSLAYWIFARAGAALLLSVPAVLLLFPTGRFVPGRWRWVSIALLVVASLLPVALLVAPDAVVFDRAWPAGVRTEIVPLDVGLSVMEPILLTCRTLLLLSIPGTFVVVLARARRAGPEERRQLSWLLWAGMVTVLCAAVLLASPNGGLVNLALSAIMTVVSASVAVGIARPDLGDVDALVAGTLTFSAVAAAMLVLDLAVLSAVTGLVGERLSQREVTVLVLLLAVSAYGPLRSVIGGIVRRLLFGRRAERYDVVSGFAARLEEASTVEGQVPVLATAVARAFKVPFARVEVSLPGGGAVAADHGTPAAEVQEMEIAYRGERVGRLVLPRRGVRALLSRRDRDLLVDLVRQAAVAVRAGLLAREVQESRERLVLSREEDRRRIRRDLHDGLGPQLASQTLTIDAIFKLLPHDPAAARGLLQHLKTQSQQAIADIRRLVYALRPPALDDLGLLAALRAQAAQYDGSGVQIVVVAPAALPALPAAVEVAAYRIAQEAMTNVVKHAGAQRCVVELALGDGLTVTIADDGRGLAAERRAGVGLVSMQERAAELGGRLSIGERSGGGTCVAAWLPLPPAERHVLGEDVADSSVFRTSHVIHE
jgi:signal transduction histidine kinase